MHVITRKRLQEFWQTHPDAERPLKTWLAIVRLKRYSGPHEVRQDFASASFLGKWRMVFNIYIRHVLTHAEYERWTQVESL